MAKKNKGQQNIEDVAFILGDVQRFAAMTPAEVKANLGESPYRMFTHLRHPTRGLFFCSPQAWSIFHDLAERTMTPGSLAAKSFHFADYVNALREAFVELFLDGGKTAGESSVQKLINRATEIANKALVECTQHVPCVIFLGKMPSKFSIGPVSFTWCEQFLDEMQDSLSDFRQRSIDYYLKSKERYEPGTAAEQILPEASDFADREVNDLRAYYAHYGWVASVAIPKCHETLSSQRAERTIDAALDVLRLFTVSDPGRIRRANAAYIPYDRYGITTNKEGKIAATHWREAKGAPTYDKWYAEIFNHPVTKKVWELFETEIIPLTEGRCSDPLNERILDALNWFGQAFVESNPGAKVVKFAASLERLTMTGHAENIEEIVVKRVMTLNQDRIDKSQEKIQKDLEDLYECRSNLMHGSISPYHRSVSTVLPNAVYATRWSLFNAIQLFAHLRAAGKANRKDLAKVYDAGRVSKIARNPLKPPQSCDPRTGNRTGNRGQGEIGVSPLTYSAFGQ